MGEVGVLLSLRSQAESLLDIDSVADGNLVRVGQ